MLDKWNGVTKMECVISEILLEEHEIDWTTDWAGHAVLCIEGKHRERHHHWQTERVCSLAHKSLSAVCFLQAGPTRRSNCVLPWARPAVVAQTSVAPPIAAAMTHLRALYASASCISLYVTDI